MIKIYAAYPVLKIVVDVGRNINYKVITAHIAEQAHKTTLIKLYKLLANLIMLVFEFLQVIFREYVARDSWNMLLDQCFIIR